MLCSRDLQTSKHYDIAEISLHQYHRFFVNRDFYLFKHRFFCILNTDITFTPLAEIF